MLLATFSSVLAAEVLIIALTQFLATMITPFLFGTGVILLALIFVAAVELNRLMWTDYMDYIFTDDFDSYEEACHMASRLGEYSLFAISISDFLTNSIYVGIGTNDLNFDLLRELEQSGVKYNPNDIVAITKTADGKLVWLENGNANAGLNHILTHADQFVDKGIPRKNISDFIMHALENGKIVGHQRTRPIYEVMYNGKLQRVAISIGDNGFIVGANPKSIP